MIERTFRAGLRKLGGLYNSEANVASRESSFPWWESEYILSQRGVTISPRIGHAIVRALYRVVSRNSSRVRCCALHVKRNQNLWPLV